MMQAQTFIHKAITLLVLVSILLASVAPVAQAQDGDTIFLPLTFGQDSSVAPDDPVPAPANPPLPDLPTIRMADDGEWPHQIVGSTGAIRKNQHGPQRNDPAEGIPVHAYSPFDERNNREHPCPPEGCDVIVGQVLVKLASQVSTERVDARSARVLDMQLQQSLDAAGIAHLEPLFPGAQAPDPGARIMSATGESVALPDLTRWYRALLTEQAADIGAVVDKLMTSEQVDWAEPDYVRRLAEVPDEQPPAALSADGARRERPNATDNYSDPLYSQQWHLGAANIPAAWDHLTGQGLPAGGSRDIIVAVIDTGVDYTHPDLAANMWVNSQETPGNGVDDDGNGFVDDIHGANVVSNQHTGNPADDHGHGTHVAGIIAAQAGNNLGGVGVAHNVQVMAIKAAQYSGVLATSDIAEGIYYAIEQGADIINMSFGGYARSQVEEDALAVAFGQAVLVAAAGNDAQGQPALSVWARHVSGGLQLGAGCDGT